jgi:hypothetical protein
MAADAPDTKIDQAEGPDAPSSGRRPARQWFGRADIVFGVIVALYVLVKVIVLTRFEVFTAFDTGSYVARIYPDVRGPNVSFLGEAPRPWGVPLLYSAFPTDWARAAMQIGVSTVAWVTLAYALWLHLTSRTAKIVGACAVLGLSLTSAVYTWDFAILSESLSTSLGVLVFGLFAVWGKTRSRMAIVAMTAVAFLWIFTRQDILPLGVLLVATLAVYAWRSRERRLPAAIAAMVLVTAMAWLLAIQPKIDETFADWGVARVPQSEETLLYRLRLSVLRDRSMTAVYKQELGMPTCTAAERVAKRTSWAMADFARAYRGCPELVAWAKEHKMDAAHRYALAAPRHYTKVLVASTLPQALGEPPRYAKPVLPQWADRAVFPAEAWVLPILVGTTLIALAACWWSGALRRRRWLVVAGAVLVPASVLSVLASLMLTAGEYARFGVQESVLLRVGIVLLIVAALDAALTRGSEARG